MWIVRLALQRPYTFIVMALVIVLLTPLVLLRTPTDIFPEINIPVISLVWTFTGLQPQEMEQRITGNVERGIAIAQRHRGHQGLFPAEREHSNRAGANRGDFADLFAVFAAGHHAPAGHY